jgi:hypothetical protein
MGIALIPFVALLSIVAVRRQDKAKNDGSRQRKLRTFIIILILGIHVMALVYNWNILNAGYGATGYHSIIDKTETNDSFTFKIRTDNEDIDFECDKDTYAKLIVDENIAYAMAYRYAAFDKERGYLKTIDTADIIDNR